jgi:uncharacterized protein
VKVLLTGGTGLVGSALVRRLVHLNHSVTVLTRQPTKAIEKLPHACRVQFWNPNDSQYHFEIEEGTQAIVHLAGESVIGGRWTPAFKDKISASRILSTRLLVDAIGRMRTPPTVFICAGAIGIYGDRQEEVLNESSSPGEDFLAGVCKDGEAEAARAQTFGLRWVSLRIGLVLDFEATIMDRILPAFRLGLGARLGSGKQWMSWIHLQDLINIFLLALQRDDLNGPVNAVAPEPISNETFSTTIGSTLNRSVFFRVPLWGLKLLLGQSAGLLLPSQKVSAQKILDHDFKFSFPSIKLALNEICGHREHVLIREQWFDQPLETCFEFHSSIENIERLAPPSFKFRIVKTSHSKLDKEVTLDYRLRAMGLPMRWRTEITEFNPPTFFSDRQVIGPYALWEHTHEFFAIDGGTLARDTVKYILPFGAIGTALGLFLVQKDLDGIFSYRRKKLVELLGGPQPRHQQN